MNRADYIFCEKVGVYLGVAELSLIDPAIYQDIIDGFVLHGRWYYFNRLKVPVPIQHQGVASRLMEQVCVWSDEDKVNILLNINPYGTLTFEDLVKFYSKYGFKYCSDGAYVRLHS